MRITEYTQDLAPAVSAFNARLKAGGSSFELIREGHVFSGERQFVLLDGDIVRGGYRLLDQWALAGGSRETISFLQLPLSEGIVDSRYALAGVQILKDALRQGPLMFALGIGSTTHPLSLMLRALGARLQPVPFLFRVCRPYQFLRSIQALRRTFLRRLVLDVTALSGLAVPVMLGWHRWKSRSMPGLRGVETSEEASFGAWADEVWSAAKGGYSFIAGRDAEALNFRFRAADSRLHRLRIRDSRGEAGWAVVSDHQHTGDQYFGRMRLGAIVDCLARPGCEALVTAAATEYLRGRGVDLIVSNQGAASWVQALETCGFLEAASNFVFAPAAALAKKIIPSDPKFSRVHINRGDGDGPINL